ncbi:MAG TPA: hypothetical protein DCP63_08060 [Bacteroidetes bacterium]|nr:hypothetical protein [Bacteroidota bacterium]
MPSGSGGFSASVVCLQQGRETLPTFSIHDRKRMKIEFSIRLVLLVLLAFLIDRCAPEKPETTTKGHLHVLIAESVAPVIVAEVNEFLSIYAKNGANITYSIVSSNEAIESFVIDTIRCIIVTRPLTTEERRQVLQHETDISEILLAYDGLAGVVHYKNPVEQITTTELREILSGKMKRWEQLSKAKGANGPISVVVQDSSDVTMFLGTRLLHGQPIRSPILRAASSLLTLRTLAGRPQAIGFVGIDWIDSGRVPAKVLEVAELDAKADTTFPPPIESVGKFYTPHPAHIYRSYYPMKRAIYFYAKARPGTLVNGFGSYVANKDGQRLFLKRNLVPGTQPIRLRVPE